MTVIILELEAFNFYLINPMNPVKWSVKYKNMIIASHCLADLPILIKFTETKPLYAIKLLIYFKDIENAFRSPCKILRVEFYLGYSEVLFLQQDNDIYFEFLRQFFEFLTW